MRVNNRLVPNPEAFTKWREHSTTNMVVNYRENLSKLKGIRIDVGTEDGFKFIPVNAKSLSLELTNNGIKHIFETYNGDHRNRLWGIDGRLYNQVFPYFSSLLSHK